MLMTLWRFIRALLRGFKDVEFRGLFYFVTLLLGSGTVAFHGIEKWSWLDSLYHSVTTLTTLGDNKMPVTTSGKVFTIVYLLVGLGSMSALIFHIATHVKDQYPNPRMRRKTR